MAIKVQIGRYYWVRDPDEEKGATIAQAIPKTYRGQQTGFAWYIVGNEESFPSDYWEAFKAIRTPLEAR